MSLATLTLLVLTLCPPRPRLMALARRPGFVALFAAMVPIAIVVGLDVVDHAASHWLFSSSVRINMPNRMPFNLELLINDARGLPGYSVAAAWGLLWIGRRWRTAPSWIDVVGTGRGGLLDWYDLPGQVLFLSLLTSNRAA